MDTNVPAAATTATTPPAATGAHKLGLVALTLLVVSAMVGGGVFNLPQNMAQSAGLIAVLASWLISGL
jgi:arginine:ornithine antiporter/lysine permease